MWVALRQARPCEARAGIELLGLLVVVRLHAIVMLLHGLIEFFNFKIDGSEVSSNIFKGVNSLKVWALALYSIHFI